MTAVPPAPDTLVLTRQRDLAGRRLHVGARRALPTVLAAIPVLALANVFGQGPHAATVTSSAARLELSAPAQVRGGLLWQARFTVAARRGLKDGSSSSTAAGRRE